MAISIWTEIEVTVVLQRYVRVGELTSQAFTKVTRDIEDWIQRGVSRLDLDQSSGRIALSLASERSLKLSGQDALHLGLAISANAVLVTFDQRLADAAQQISHSVLVP